MYEEPVSPLTRLWYGVRKKTADTVGRQAVGFVRGRVAGMSLIDAEGSSVVEAGQVVDDEVIARAEEAAGHLGRTAIGQQLWAEGTAGEYAEALNYTGYVTADDVTDIRGNVIVPADKKIDETDIQAARAAGQLSALLYSVKQGGPGRSASKKKSSAGRLPRMHKNEFVEDIPDSELIGEIAPPPTEAGKPAVRARESGRPPQAPPTRPPSDLPVWEPPKELEGAPLASAPPAPSEAARPATVTPVRRSVPLVTRPPAKKEDGDGFAVEMVT